MSDKNKISWNALALMAFSTVWGFGNILNGFVYFNGVQVIFSWLLMFALYFIPYALMVGELGSAFKATGGGVRAGCMKLQDQSSLIMQAGPTGHVTSLILPANPAVV